MSIAGVEPGGVAGEAAALAVHRRVHMTHDLKYVVKDGCAWAGMMGFGEHLFQAMVLAFAMGEQARAMAAVIPAFVGSAGQLCTPWLVQKLRSHKRTVLFGSLLQVCCFVPLAVVCVVTGSGQLDRPVPVWFVLAVLSVYQFGGLAAGAAWSTWVSTIVPQRVRGGYFSMRTRWIYVVQLCSLLSAGAFCGGLRCRGPGVLWGFALSMLIAGGSHALDADGVPHERAGADPARAQAGGPARALWKLLHGPSGAGGVLFSDGARASDGDAVSGADDARAAG